jgi:outer membrane protein TolC
LFGLCGVLFISVGVGVCLGGGSDPTPVVPVPTPVAPVIPAPTPPSSHHIRYQNLLPGHIGKAGEQPPNGKIELPIETGPELSLGECIAIALDRQPTIKAMQASIKASETGYQALLNFGTTATIISPDLEIRKQQAQRGLAAALSDCQKVRNEVIQDVTRLYYLAVFAKQSGMVADNIVSLLEEMASLIEKILNSKVPVDQLGGLTVAKLRVVQMGVLTTKKLSGEAAIGRQQALAALREAMGVDERCFAFRVKDTELPVMSQDIPVTLETVVELALARRPELALAAAGVDVFRLEVYAQGKLPFSRKVPTFASGGDLHSKDVPATIRAKEYRPGGIMPEMPTQLVGTKYDRVERAMAYSEKAEQVYEKARNLVVLEAQNAFYEYKLANENLIYSKAQVELANDLFKRTRENVDNIKEKDQIVQAYITVGKVQADYTKAILDHVLALAALERITAGGVQPAFPGR